MKLVCLLGSLLGIFPSYYTKGRIVRLPWAITLQILHLFVVVNFLYQKIMRTLDFEIFSKSENISQGGLLNRTSYYFIEWNMVRLMADYSETLSGILGLVMGWTSFGLVNNCLSTCNVYSNLMMNNIPYYIRASSILTVCIHLFPLIALLIYNFTFSISVMDLETKMYVDFVIGLPNKIIDSLLTLLLFYVGEEVKCMNEVVRHLTSKNFPSVYVSPFNLPLVEETFIFPSSRGSGLLSEQLHYMRLHHTELSELMRKILSRFQLYIFFSIFRFFLKTIVVWYIPLFKILSESALNGFMILKFSNYLMEGIIQLFALWIICKGPQNIKEQITELDAELYSLCLLHPNKSDNSLIKEVHYLKMQCKEMISNMDILGMFTLSSKFFFNSIMTVIMYITVFEQFNIAFH